MSEPLYAFPCTHDVQPEPGFKRGILVERGMTLRDYFAAAALMGANASPELMQILTSKEVGDGSYFERISASVYRQADAMLKARDA